MKTTPWFAFLCFSACNSSSLKTPQTITHFFKQKIITFKHSPKQNPFLLKRTNIVLPFNSNKNRNLKPFFFKKCFFFATSSPHPQKKNKRKKKKKTLNGFLPKTKHQAALRPRPRGQGGDESHHGESFVGHGGRFGRLRG